MAATEYYGHHPANPVGGPQPSYLSPPPPQGPLRASSHPAGFPYQQTQYAGSGPSTPYGQPPPYQPTATPQETEHKLQAPSSNPQLRTGSSQPIQPYQSPHVAFAGPTSDPYASPQPYSVDPRTQQYFPPPPPTQPQHRPLSYGQQAPYQTPQHQHAVPYGQPSGTPNYLPSPSLGVDQNGYASDPEARRHRHPRRRRASSGTKRDHTSESLLGGAAGGLIGDLIFPGLGTVGGALAGFWGGREHGKLKDRQRDKREEEQRRWEKKWGRGDHER